MTIIENDSRKNSITEKPIKTNKSTYNFWNLQNQNTF